MANKRLRKSLPFLCIVFCAAFVILFGWADIGSIRVDMPLIIVVAALFFIDDALLLAIGFLVLVAAMQWQFTIGIEYIVLAGIVSAIFGIRPYVPWPPAIAYGILLAIGTFVFTAILNPVLLWRVPSLIVEEILYNEGIGLVLYAAFLQIYGRTLPFEKTGQRNLF